MKINARSHALSILIDVFKNKSSLAKVLPAEAAPMTKELCYGVCRQYVRLEAIADRLMDKRPKSIEIWLLILIGLYQLQYMQAPDYAVVKETVALLGALKKTWAKGLVNAVLRQFCRNSQQILSDLAEDDAFIYGQPQWLLQHLQTDWPDDWQVIALANDVHPPMTLRVNTQQTTLVNYLTVLEKAGIEAYAHPLVPSAVTLVKPIDVTQLPGFTQGMVSVQDAAAQLAASLLSLKPGLRILDACCAPGGKLCHILESQPDLAACIGLDIEEYRLKKVRENVQRIQLQASLISGDALKPEQWWDKKLFDRILLDAPCSATGVIRRHSDIKVIRTDEQIKAIQKIQQNMLHSLWQLLAPGGLLVYATCSIIAEENEQQIAAFVTEHSDCSVVQIDGAWGRATGHGRQIVSGEEGMDGFFYSVLIKN